VDAMPLACLADALRQTMVGPAPLHPLSTDLLVLVVWLVICAVLAVKFFRWEEDGCHGSWNVLCQ
jgi:ABC-2 type transport system permease protein